VGRLILEVGGKVGILVFMGVGGRMVFLLGLMLMVCVVAVSVAVVVVLVVVVAVQVVLVLVVLVVLVMGAMLKERMVFFVLHPV